MTTKELTQLTQKQKSIRYAISVDFDCMRDSDYCKEDALAWFSSEELTVNGSLFLFQFQNGTIKSLPKTFAKIVDYFYKQ